MLPKCIRRCVAVHFPEFPHHPVQLRRAIPVQGHQVVPAVADSVHDEVDRRQVDDTVSDLKESVQFAEKVLLDVEVFREEVDISQVFRRRAVVMKSVSKFMRRSEHIMEKVSAARLARDVLRQIVAQTLSRKSCSEEEVGGTDGHVR